MNRTLPIFTALLIALSTAAVAQVPRVLAPLEKSYELGLGEIVFPTSVSGSVAVRPCSDCSSATHRVGQATIYLVNHLPVPFEDFLKTVDERRRSRRANEVFVGVYYDIESRHVNRILLTYPQ